jgi:2-keto-3-deoxy-L-rhamnonate aldolase RhmA
MQPSPVATLKQKLRRGDTTYGFWVTLESPSITEIACRLGFDWIVVDAEHGHLDFRDIMEHIRVANLMRTVCFVHISEIQMGLITRMLDLGADGIFLPQVRSAEDVALGVRYAKYPPLGTRGLAAERSTRWGRAMQAKVRSANDETMVIPMVETVEAAAALDSILDTPGIDAILFGPADFSSSSGFPGEWEGPGVAEQILGLQQRIRQRGLPCVVIARDAEDAERRRNEKFQLIGLGSDTGLMIRSAAEMLVKMGVGVPPDAWH